MMTQKNTYQDLADFIHAFKLQTDVKLSCFTTFGIGGKADLLALPQNRNELVDLLSASEQMDLPVTLIGGGSNLLISDKGIRGLVIVTCKMATPISCETIDDDQVQVRVDAGYNLFKLIRFCAKNGLSGLEQLAGIPGTVGGAVMMNAGIPDAQISDRLHSLEVWNRQGCKLAWQTAGELDFSYRNLNLEGVIISVRFLLKKAPPETLFKEIDKTLQHKKKTQPVSQPSAGCFFKNPATGMTAGELIDKAGMKGICVNDAMVSEKHANYIINRGNATSKDILDLMQKVQEAVFEKFDINLETEVRIEGE